MTTRDILILGGGAAGYFTAINLAEQCPGLIITILERSKEVLSKVKVSGGGRCNVTHAEFVPQQLVTNYPRGEKELLGPFHQFMTGDTVAWFEARGVPLKVEDDGRMFPVSNSSQSIIDCFVEQAQTYGVEVLTQHAVIGLDFKEDRFEVHSNHGVFQSKILVVATGSSPKMWQLLEGLGHSIVAPVASLFTFNTKDPRLKDLPGVSLPWVSVEVLDTDLYSEGPLLVTHWGLSGPAILKLSAFGALALAQRDYRFEIAVNVVGRSATACVDTLKTLKQTLAKKTVYKVAPFELPKRLWQSLAQAAGLDSDQRWADTNNAQLEALAQQLCRAVFQVEGKSTFKEEFVTAGGVDLKEVHFKSFESKLLPGLYFAGEVLNIDAVTGGFNFQSAWTGGYIAASHIAGTLTKNQTS